MKAITKYRRVGQFVVVFASSAVLMISGQSCGRAASMDSAVSKKLPAETAQLAAEIKDLGDEHVHMPPLPTTYSTDRYINVLPEYLRDSLRGKVVVLDVWDYTCVNCIRTLPYIERWSKKYAKDGLVIVGVHSPEFQFEKDPGNLDSAVRRFGLTYPIIADNDFAIWQSLANQYWPAKYVFDAKGVLRAAHFGEGEYQEFEAFLQKILLERDSTLALPALEPLVREADKPGAVCYPVTPETYIGFERSHLGNDGGEHANEGYAYRAGDELEHDRLYLDGDWLVRRQFASPSGSSPSSLVINYQAYEVNLVMHPSDSGAPIRVELLQDGKPLPKEDWGADVRADGASTVVWVDRSRMYNLVKNAKVGRHTLRISSDSPRLGAYAFTFTSDCMAP